MMPPEHPAPPAGPPTRACLAFGPWLAVVAGERHRHVCMLDQGHPDDHECAWHPSVIFYAEGFLDRGILP